MVNESRELKSLKGVRLQAYPEDIAGSVPVKRVSQ